MKNLKGLILLGLGFLIIQSCSRQSQVCECLDMATEMMKGDREHNYDGTFRSKYLDEHKEENRRCDEFAEGVKDDAAEKKVMDEMGKCPGHAAYNDELSRQSAYYEEKN